MTHCLSKMNGTLLKIQNHLPQISVQELYSDAILAISVGVFFGARTVDVKYILEILHLGITCKIYIKQVSKKNKITCRCKTCISYMLLITGFNKCRISQLS